MTSKAKITEAVRSLDPDDDDHWTIGGTPTVHAVAEATGDHTLTREDIDSASGNWNREAAQGAKAAPASKAVDQPETAAREEVKSAPKAAPVKAANRFPDAYPDNNAYVVAATDTGPVIAQYRNDPDDNMTSRHGGFYSRVGAGGYTILEGKVSAWAPMPDLAA